MNSLELDSSLDLRIIKLGGSLLTQVQLSSHFRTWLADQPEACNLIVVGGGEVVEAVRDLDQIHQLDSSFTHWLCVDLMHETAALAQKILAVDSFFSTPSELVDGNVKLTQSNNDNRSNSAVAILSPKSFYTRELASINNCPLSETWQTTSDSIAAWLAKRMGAHELVLLKSPNALLEPSGLSFRSPKASDLTSLSELGLIDGSFPAMAEGLSVVRIESIG